MNRVTDAQMDAAIAGISQRGSVAAAARAQGVSRSTFRGWHEAAQRREEEQKPLPIDTAPFLAKLKAKRHQRLVITWAQNATPVHKPFLSALERFCRENRAQLIVIPGRYKNPTSLWSKTAENDDWWDGLLEDYLLDKPLIVCRNLIVLADVKVQPTAVNPLSGFETLSGDRSAVLGHSKIALTVVPTPHERLPKILTTTGACTKKNYTPTSAGKKGEFHHSLGAALVEVDGNNFHLRQINAMNDGSFIDLDREYTATGSRAAAPAAALVMGDSHVTFIDPAVVEATFGKAGMVKRLKPKHLVWHDVNDFYAGSHHHQRLPFTQFAKRKTGLDDIEAELDRTFAFIDERTPAGTRNIFPASNHPNDHLARWIRECEWRYDPTNMLFFSRTLTALLEGTRMTESGTDTPDPFIYWARQKLRCIRRCRLLRRDESCRIAGIEVGYHGDQGLNGARGSLPAFNKIGAKTVTGHSHTPGIREGAYAVGTSSRLRLEYNQGPSSWLQTHCVIYANGKRSLLSVINGEWHQCRK